MFQMPLSPAQIARNAVLGTILRPITISPSDAASGGAATLDVSRNSLAPTQSPVEMPLQLPCFVKR